MDIQLSNSGKSITKRPIIVTVVCCIVLLSSLFSFYGIKGYLNENTREQLIGLVGEKNYSIGIIGTIINIVLIIPVIGVWKMKKSMGYIFVIIYALSILITFIHETIPSNIELEKFLAIGPIFTLAICFIIIYYVIINNPKNDFSILRQKQFGIIVGIVGIMLLIISNSQMALPDASNNNFRDTQTYVQAVIVRKNLFLYTGLFILLSGVFFFVLGLNTKQSGQLLKSEKTIPLVQPQQQNDIVNQIEKINDLFQKGILTKEEFDNKKTQLLSKM